MSHEAHGGILDQKVLLSIAHTVREPFGPDVEHACLLAFILDIEPFVDAAVCDEGGTLDFGAANQIRFGHVLIHALDMEIVTNIFNVKVESLSQKDRFVNTCIQ